MPRPRKADRPVEIHLCLPESVLLRMDLINLDPFLMAPKYGSRSAQITALLVGALFRKGEYMPENQAIIPPSLNEETVTMQQVMDLRKKLLAKEEVSLEDIRIAIAFIRQDRIAAVSSNGKKTKPKAAPKQLSDTEMDDLLKDFNL